MPSHWPAKNQGLAGQTSGRIIINSCCRSMLGHGIISYPFPLVSRSFARVIHRKAVIACADTDVFLCPIISAWTRLWPKVGGLSGHLYDADPILTQYWVNVTRLLGTGRRWKPDSSSKRFRVSGPVFSYKLWYIVGFGLVEMAISTNPKPAIYRNLYGNTDPTRV